MIINTFSLVMYLLMTFSSAMCNRGYRECVGNSFVNNLTSKEIK